MLLILRAATNWERLLNVLAREATIWVRPLYKSGLWSSIYGICLTAWSHPLYVYTILKHTHHIIYYTHTIHCKAAGKQSGALDKLLETFVANNLGVKQVREVFNLSGECSDAASVCLLTGPMLIALLKMLDRRFEELPRHRPRIDTEDVWRDTVACYKRVSFQYWTHLQVSFDGQPAIDTGQQVYCSTFQDFASNRYLKLFEGPEHLLRFVYTAEARSSGLLKVLGGMVAHSICQDGVGFPFLSPTTFWYIVAGEEKALLYACVEDLPADSSFVVKQVSLRNSWRCI